MYVQVELHSEEAIDTVFLCPGATIGKTAHLFDESVFRVTTSTPRLTPDQEVLSVNDASKLVGAAKTAPDTYAER